MFLCALWLDRAMRQMPQDMVRVRVNPNPNPKDMPVKNWALSSSAYSALTRSVENDSAIRVWDTDTDRERERERERELLTVEWHWQASGAHSAAGWDHWLTATSPDSEPFRDLSTSLLDSPHSMTTSQLCLTTTSTTTSHLLDHYSSSVQHHTQTHTDTDTCVVLGLVQHWHTVCKSERQHELQPTDNIPT